MEIHALLFSPVLLTILIYKFCWKFLVISQVSYLNHLSVSSHKKQKDSLETRAIYINLVSLWYIKNYRTTKKHRESKHGKLWRGSAACRSFSCYYGWNRSWYTCNCKEVELKINFHTSKYFFRTIPAINASFAPKYVHLQGSEVREKL